MARSSPQAAWALLATGLLAAATAHALSVPGVEGPKQKKCTIAGTWVNDLGSRVVFSAADNSGAFSGSYLTAVSASDNAIQESPLHGVQHDPGRRAQPTLGFVVHWTFSASTTAFAGQCFVDAAGEETLETLWLLREEVPSRADDWKATRVGRNVFTRVK
ncbi:avidin-like [Eublepharis macularius]|uniref:Avidin-like n=1 Tax=Eublepharis macularius TaxID=481883 RepID=A0AA97JQ75_EUBMA|nr:avidin-like [Eublepharis macularius]